MKQKLAIGLMLTAVATAALAGPIEDQIRSRQSAYGFLGWNAAKIKAQVGDHPETYNKDQVIAAANAVAAFDRLSRPVSRARRQHHPGLMPVPPWSEPERNPG